MMTTNNSTIERRVRYEKNDFDEGVSESFIRYVKELQALDSRSTKQPLYRENQDFVFGVMSDRFLSRLREKPLLDFEGHGAGVVAPEISPKN